MSLRSSGRIDHIGEVLEQQHRRQAQHQAGDQRGQHVTDDLGRDRRVVQDGWLQHIDLVGAAVLHDRVLVAQRALAGGQLGAALVQAHDQRALGDLVGGLLDLRRELVHLGLDRADALLQAGDLGQRILLALHLQALWPAGAAVDQRLAERVRDAGGGVQVGRAGADGQHLGGIEPGGRDVRVQLFRVERAAIGLL